MDPSGTFLQYDAKAIGSGSEGAQQALQEVYHKVVCSTDVHHSLRFLFSLISWLYRSLSGHAPVYLADDCHLVTDASARQLRSADTWMLTGNQTSRCFGDRTSAAAATRVWNSLLSDLTKADIVLCLSLSYSPVQNSFIICCSDCQLQRIFNDHLVDKDKVKPSGPD